MFLQVDFHENPNVGVYCRVNDEIGFVRKGLSKTIRKKISATLNIDLIEVGIADTSIIGSLLVSNSHGVIATDLVDKSVIKLITDQGLDVFVVTDVLNAAGNDMLVNDFGGIVHPNMDGEMVEEMEGILKIPLKKGTIAGLKTVGMTAVATNKGLLCHPKITEEEKQVLESLFQVPIMIGTINHGVPLIGSGLIANSFGFVVGSLTTGIEMGRIEEALGFLDEKA
jgi:translation initiation factor 6